MKIPIVDTSRLLSSDICSRNTVIPGILEIAQQCGNKVMEALGDKALSVYFYGSFAQGRTGTRYSDLDLMLFLENEPDSDTDTVIGRLEKEFSERYRHIFYCVTIDKASPHLYKKDQTLAYSFIARHISVHIAGASMDKILPRVHLNKDLGIHLNGDFFSRVRTQYNKFLIAEGNEDKYMNCRWIMKKLLRASFSLLIEKVDFYESDLDEMSQILKSFYPHQAGMIDEVTFLAHNPTIDNDTLSSIMDKYFTWLQNEWICVYGKI